MLKKFNIENRNVCIHFNKTNSNKLPVVILNTYENEGEDVFSKCNLTSSQEYILVSISNLDWNNDMSPWFAKRINKNDADFLGEADQYLHILSNKIIPQVEEYIKDKLNILVQYYAIAGYSLAGLFAVYAGYKTDLFSKIASASGSFWFPNFSKFAKENDISSNIDKIYLSLGNKESKVNNQVLAKVEENTIELEKIYKSKGIDTIYEVNPGNHFTDAPLRMAKGIKWILEDNCIKEKL